MQHSAAYDIGLHGYLCPMRGCYAYTGLINNTELTTQVHKLFILTDTHVHALFDIALRIFLCYYSVF